MRPRSVPRLRVAWATLLLLSALPGSALLAQQTPTGTLYGTASDPNGGALPGVTVELRGPGADRTLITDERGQYRFLALHPGDYHLIATLESFGPVERTDLAVRSSRSTALDLVLTPRVEETITVSGEAPILDERQISSAVSLDSHQIEKIPSGRDPYALLRYSPEVVVDRVDVAGSESANRSRFRAPAVGTNQNDYQLDGMSITSKWGLNSAIYYDIDQYAEVQYSTGGTDVTRNTAGVTINLISKRGSNQLRGSARFQYTDANGYLGGLLPQAEPRIEDLGPGQEPIPGARIGEISEWGAELGGPLVRDRLWLWGSFGHNGIQTSTARGYPLDSALDNGALRLDFQISPKNSASASWSGSSRDETGQSVGFDRAPEAGVDDGNDTNIVLLRDTHLFSSDFFVDMTVGYGDGGSVATARSGAGPQAPEAWQDADFFWRDNYWSGTLWGKGFHARLDTSYFFGSGALNHELKLGALYREQEFFSEGGWPGRQIISRPSFSYFLAAHGRVTPVDVENHSLWAQDTLTWGRLTLNLGLRWDLQRGRNLASNEPAHPLVPEVLPALDYPGASPEFEWADLQPRLGVTWALGADRQTLLRGSFAQFVDQLGLGTIRRTNPVSMSYTLFFYPSAGLPYQNEPYLLAPWIDPASLRSPKSPNVTDPGLEAPRTTEVLLAADHAIRPELVVGVAMTARRVDRIHEDRYLVREPDGTVRVLRSDEWIPSGTVGGVVPGTDYDYSVPIFAHPLDLLSTGGSLLINGSRERDYLGATVSLTRRLQHNWMLRAFVSWGQGEWDVPRDYLEYADPNRSAGGGDRDGDLFFTNSNSDVGSLIANDVDRGSRSLQASWRANVSGMVQIAPERRWGFNVAGSLTAREGYPLSLRDGEDNILGGFQVVGVSRRLDDFRLQDVVLLDLRLEKEIALKGRLGTSVFVEGFNLTNETPAQSRNTFLAGGQALWIQDTVNPRVYRLGMRLTWR